jgi:hypothetical protein
MIALALATFATAGVAAEAEQGPCADIQWSAQFLKEHPRAPSACQAVETKNGHKYAKFTGEVSSIKYKAVEVDVHDAYKTSIGKLKFKVQPGGTVVVGGKPLAVKDLKVGDELTVWVREGRYSASAAMK